MILLVSGFVRNYATMVADLSASFLASSPAQDAMANYGRLLARLTDPQRFPALHAAIASGAFDEPDEPDNEFVFGLERILDGINTPVARGPERPPPGCSPSVTTSTRAGVAHPAVHLNPRAVFAAEAERPWVPPQDHHGHPD